MYISLSIIYIYIYIYIYAYMCIDRRSMLTWYSRQCHSFQSRGGLPATLTDGQSVS